MTKKTDCLRQNYVTDVQYITLKNENLKDRLQECPKKRYHNKFVSTDEFFKNPHKHFPRTWRRHTKDYKSIEELPSLLESMAQLTCLICVQFQNEKSTGSGFVQKIRRLNVGKCPCHECDGNSVRPFAIVTVTTVLHVFDENPKVSKSNVSPEWNSKKIKVKLFYDRESDDFGSLPTLDGHRLLESDKEIDMVRDWCAIECVTHDMDVVQRLETYLNSHMDLQAEVYKKFLNLDRRHHVVVIIGHPHGGPKKISVGTFDPRNTEILKDVRNYQRWCRYNYNVLTCQGSSGSPVFILGQPLCGFGYWFGHPHNHSKGMDKTMGGYSSVGVEHLPETENVVKYGITLWHYSSIPLITVFLLMLIAAMFLCNVAVFLNWFISSIFEIFDCVIHFLL